MGNQGVPRRPSSVSTDRQPQNDDCSYNGRPKAVVIDRMEDMLKDLSLEASGRYIGASSHITMGRIISSMVQSSPADEASPSSAPGGEQGEPLSPKSADNGNQWAPPLRLDLAQLPASTADRLYVAYDRHISKRWPVFPTVFTYRTHASRSILSDPFS